MAQEDKNVTIPPEMMQEIVRVASETAIEKFQHEAERNRKAVKDKRLHNTKLLLQNYHCFVEHSKSAVYEASQLSEDDDFEELMEELMSQSDGRVRVPVVRSIQESAAHTRIIVQHIDRMLEYYKFRCEHSKRVEEMRRYRTIYDLYIIAIYRILSYLEQALDYDEPDMSQISSSALGLSANRWLALLRLLEDAGYIEVFGHRTKITLRGLEYLQQNSLMQRAVSLMPLTRQASRACCTARSSARNATPKPACLTSRVSAWLRS